MLNPGYHGPMARYSAVPDSSPQQQHPTGVLVANLGTPDAPTPAAVRRYLAEFLWDPRVVELPRPLWWLILNGFILPFRPRQSARAYREIWTAQGSPLLLTTRSIAAGIGERLGAAVVVEPGMSYGQPSITAALERLRARGARRMVVLPLYPQYSGSTAGSVFDAVARTLQRWRRVPELHFIADYHDVPGYIAALAASVREHFAGAGRSHLLMSFHGTPKGFLDAGDPYQGQCLRTGRLLADALGLGATDWSLTFQSRLGRSEWLQPYTDAVLQELPGRGVRRVAVICPGFAADCLETLEEIAMRGRETFLEAGGESFDFIPCLNAGEDHIAALAGLVRQALPPGTAAGCDAPASLHTARTAAQAAAGDLAGYR
jgi:ferrochelatase